MLAEVLSSKYGIDNYLSVDNSKLGKSENYSK